MAGANAEKGRLLVVDDEELNRDVLARRLQRSGFEVETATNGEDALEKIAAGGYDLVLLDQVMPGVSGADVLRALRTEHSLSELPVIMMTALEGPRVAEALDLGANDCVSRPIEFTSAVARIRSQLSRRRAERERKHREIDRKQREERYSLAVQASREGLWDWDLAANEIYYSERWKEMMGLAGVPISRSPEEWFSRVHPEDLKGLERALDAHLTGAAPVFSAQYRVRLAEGGYRWMAVSGLAARNSPARPERIAGAQNDITDSKTRDPLTGLANRVAFDQLVEGELRRSATGEETGFALLLVDLDRFKSINVTLGHLAGDTVLKEFGARLIIAAAEFQATAARLAGDEFGVVVPNVTGRSTVMNVAERIQLAMRAPFAACGQDMVWTASVGAVIRAPEHISPVDLVRDADAAMYAAKVGGRGRTALFDPRMRDRIANRLNLERDLHLALLHGEFVVLYQPRVDLYTSRICGFEALVRWNHPERGLIEPSEFIGIAEDTGLIREIGLHVMESSCEQIRVWNERWPHLDVAVNVSPAQLKDPQLIQRVREIVSRTRVNPGSLQVEITESSFIENIDATRKILLALKELGIGLKLDDFATGYSCLRLLYQLPFDAIKIDRSFTVDLREPGSEGRELVRSIVEMARNLRLGVIVEGIEEEEGVEALRDLGCRYAQGYFFSRAVSAAEIEILLEQEDKRDSALAAAGKTLAG